MRKHLTVLIGTAFAAASLVLVSPAQAVTDTPGSTPDNPIIVASLDDVPEGAVANGITKDECATTTSFVLTVPGSDETSHAEARYLREVPASEETSHQEWGVDERTRTATEEHKYKRKVEDFKTIYHFAKYTETRTKPRGGQWSAFGPWTLWTPITHQSWEDSDAPLGSPAPHASGTYANGTKWERLWQARAIPGDTDEVSTGFHYEYVDFTSTPPAGDGWVVIGSRTVFGEWSPWTQTQSGLLTAPTPPANTTTHEYSVTGPVKHVDTEATPGYTEYYVLGGEPSRNRDDASWILPAQAPEGWTQFEERSASNNDGTPEVVTYYAFNDGVKCDSPPPTPPENPPTPPNTPPLRELPKTGLDAAPADSDIDGGLLLAGGACLLAAGGVLLLARRRPEDV